MIEPQNGQTFGGPGVQGRSLVYSGFTTNPRELIEVQVLADASADPTLDRNWVMLGENFASPNSSSPITDATGTVWYPWILEATPSTRLTMWAQGGLLRVRVRAHAIPGDAGVPFAIFDEDFSACVGSKNLREVGFNQVWLECGSRYLFATLVSTFPDPTIAKPRLEHLSVVATLLPPPNVSDKPLSYNPTASFNPLSCHSCT